MFSSGRLIVQTLQKLGVSERTIHPWRSQNGGIMSEEAKRLKELEVEKAQFKRRVTKKSLDASILKRANNYPRNRKFLAAEDRREPRAG